jgi:hypothetical protein
MALGLEAWAGAGELGLRRFALNGSTILIIQNSNIKIKKF